MTIGISDVVVRRRGHTILDRASVELGPGIHGIIGRNGVGKTTLLRVLAHHMRVTAGTVHGLGTTALARVAPDVRFAGATVGQHLDVAAVGHPGLDRELALDILAAAGIDARTRTATLSAGRRQLLSVATALSSGADAILLDEPFTGLDVGLRRALRDHVIAVAGDHPDLCLVLTSHRSEDLAGLVDDVTTIADSGIVVGPISLDAARSGFPTLRGPSAMVDVIAGETPRASAKHLGGIAEVTLSHPLSCSASRRATAEGITVTEPEDGELIDLLALHGAPAGPDTATATPTSRTPETTRNEP